MIPAKLKNILIRANIVRKTIKSYFTNRSLIVTLFQKLYYKKNDQTMFETYWMGVPALKCPLDLWVYQEILYETKPDVIVECGTKKGGTSFFLASMCDLMNKGRIITIDVIDFPEKPNHNRITYLHGSSTSKEIEDKVGSLIKEGERVMVILDSNHRRRHVLNELRIYNKFVTKGDYLIVEDTNINGHPVFCNYGPGPMEAVDLFMKENHDFIADRGREKFMMTFNPKGYLRKKK